MGSNLAICAVDRVLGTARVDGKVDAVALVLAVTQPPAGFFVILFSFLSVPIRGKQRSYMLAMHESRSDVFDAMGGVGWYKCPKGHLYAVGECTMFGGEVPFAR
jgi:hypothetical protein